MMIKAIVRPESMYNPSSLRAVSATAGVTLYAGNLRPGADPTVRTHADVIQRVEFEGMTESEAQAWLSQNGIKGTIQAPPKKAKSKKAKKNS